MAEHDRQGEPKRTMEMHNPGQRGLAEAVQPAGQSWPALPFYSFVGMETTRTDHSSVQARGLGFP
jgi:hypothetical protein